MANLQEVAQPSSSNEPGSTSLSEIALLFLRLGATSFGGPAAHIAMMEEEVVRRRNWLSRDQFLDLLGATNLIPGPNSTELAIHIGHHRASWLGLVVAGCCFILPAVIIVMMLAWVYVSFGKLLVGSGLLYGIKPVIIAVVLQALWSLSRTAVKTKFLALIGLAVAALNLYGVNELIVLFGAGTIVLLYRWATSLNKLNSLSINLFTLLPVNFLLTSMATAANFSLWHLFLFFLKVGSVLFGSGYVLLAFLRADLVERFGWLQEAQLLDAIAVGQVTPGPVFTTATFIGYLLAGPIGALIGTVGIFLPAFFFVAVSGPLLPRLRKSPIAAAFLDGVNVASLALMAVVTWQLGRATIIDLTTAGLALISAVLLIRFRINSVWLILAGAIIGLIVSLESSL